MHPLEARDLTKRFGSLVAVDHVTVAFEEGAITVIIGPNGAGKTTFFNLLSGVLRPDEGRVFLYGKDVTKYPPHKRVELGLGRSFQSINVFPYLTVLESVVLSAAFREFNKVKIRHVFKGLLQYREYVEEALGILQSVGLEGREGKLVASLNQADQRKLDIALAIASKPRVLLLDEPTAGLALEEIPSLVELIGKLREEFNLTVVMIEHKMDVVRKLAEHVVVMSEGRVVAEGTPEEVSRNELVAKAYLGVESLE